MENLKYGGRVRSHCVEWRTLNTRKGDGITWCAYGKALTSQLFFTLLSLAVATPENNVNSFKAVIYTHESTHKVWKSASHAVLGRMQITLHGTRRTPHGASRLVQAMSAWLVKARHAPSRHCRDARVIPLWSYDTAMHEYRVHPPPPPNRIGRRKEREKR